MIMSDKKIKLTATEYRRLSKAEPDLMRQLSSERLLSIVRDAEYKAHLKESYRVWTEKLTALQADLED